MRRRRRAVSATSRGLRDAAQAQRRDRAAMIVLLRDRCGCNEPSIPHVSITCSMVCATVPCQLLPARLANIARDRTCHIAFVELSACGIMRHSRSPERTNGGSMRRLDVFACALVAVIGVPAARLRPVAAAIRPPTAEEGRRQTRSDGAGAAAAGRQAGLVRLWHAAQSQPCVNGDGRVHPVRHRNRRIAAWRQPRPRSPGRPAVSAVGGQALEGAPRPI